jgi:nickel/cobalt transporter (NiCoT) family protein
MGLIGANCRSCQEAQERGGLAGHWWDAWANVRVVGSSRDWTMSDNCEQASDNLGYVGAGIVGSFVVIVVAWYSWRWWSKQMKGRTGVNDDRLATV